MALAAAMLLVLFMSPAWAPPTLPVGFGLGLLWLRRVATGVAAGLSAVVIVAILNSSQPAGAEDVSVVFTILLGAFLPACALVSAAGYRIARLVRRRGQRG